MLHVKQLLSNKNSATKTSEQNPANRSDPPLHLNSLMQSSCTSSSTSNNIYGYLDTLFYLQVPMIVIFLH